METRQGSGVTQSCIITSRVHYETAGICEMLTDHYYNYNSVIQL